MSREILNQADFLETYKEVAEKLSDELPDELLTNKLVFTIFKEDDGCWSGYVEVEEIDLKVGDILLTGERKRPRIVQRKHDGKLMLVDTNGKRLLTGERIIRDWLARGDYEHTGQSIFNLVKEWKEKVEFESEDRIVSGVRQ